MAEEKEETFIDRIFNAVKSTLAEGLIALGITILLGANQNVPLWIFWPLWFALYMIGCFFFYRAVCFWCAGKKERKDGRGHYRDYTCRWCDNSGRRMRWGARVMGKV